MAVEISEEIRHQIYLGTFCLTEENSELIARILDISHKNVKNALFKENLIAIGNIKNALEIQIAQDDMLIGIIKEEEFEEWPIFTIEELTQSMREASEDIDDREPTEAEKESEVSLIEEEIANRQKTQLDEETNAMTERYDLMKEEIGEELDFEIEDIPTDQLKKTCDDYMNSIQKKKYSGAAEKIQMKIMVGVIEKEIKIRNDS